MNDTKMDLSNAKAWTNNVDTKVRERDFFHHFVVVVDIFAQINAMLMNSIQ